MNLAASVVLFALIGFGAGALHFAALADSVQQLARGGSAWRNAAFLLLRFALSGAVLLVAARQGALVLAAALGGWLLARSWRLRAERRP